MSCIILDGGDTTVNKTEKAPVFMEFIYIIEGEIAKKEKLHKGQDHFSCDKCNKGKVPGSTWVVRCLPRSPSQIMSANEYSEH